MFTSVTTLLQQHILIAQYIVYLVRSYDHYKKDQTAHKDRSFLKPVEQVKRLAKYFGERIYLSDTPVVTTNVSYCSSSHANQNLRQ